MLLCVIFNLPVCFLASRGIYNHSYLFNRFHLCSSVVCLLAISSKNSLSKNVDTDNEILLF